jgi:hypothetical protein
MCFYLVESTAENNYWAQASQFIQRTSSHSLPAQNRQEWVSFSQIKYHTLCAPRRKHSTTHTIEMRWLLLLIIVSRAVFLFFRSLRAESAASTLGPRRVSLVYIRFLLVDSQNPASARSRPSRKGAKKCGCSLKRARERERCSSPAAANQSPRVENVYTAAASRAHYYAVQLAPAVFTWNSP